MTCLLSSSRSIRSRSLAPCLIVLATTLLFSACEDKHIGRPCDLGLPAGQIIDPTVVTVNVAALECPSRVCVLPSQQRSTDTGPLCTDGCGSDDDCSGAESRGASNPKGCQLGFACRTILPQVANPLACKPICVCKDFLPTGDTGSVPLSCQ